jgi:hypothetical protein
MRLTGTTSRLLASAALLVLATACGGGGGGNGGGVVPGGRVAGFVADDPTPPADSLSLQQGSRTGDTVNVLVQATGVDSFFGAAFRVSYDPSVAQYQSFDSAGSFLRDGGFTDARLRFEVNASVPGELVVVATRLQNQAGTEPGVTIGATPRTLLSLRFKALVDTAGSRINLASPREARDSQDALLALVWLGGAITAN